jgi:formate hydrogenlyase transcriptional activator
VSDLDLIGRAAKFMSLDDSLNGMALPGSAVHIARENRHRQIGGASVMEQTYAEGGFRQIAGNSAALKSALADVERVAPTNATVLLLGETGTGKELFARAIHNLSPRSERPFVKLDCAAIPFDLLDSELFGHEKGAFPWALAHRIGRFEMADAGTLFLDEIGDLPLALQPKLLRVLQEHEFERPGSSRTHRVNVRLIAATHRDLVGMIRQGEFRSDLYYRLNGFPIKLPPLRERREDIPLLVSHFVEMFSRRIGKQIHHIPAETLSAFTAHSWPGNVRELQNLIERAIILSNDGVLPNPLSAMARNSTRVAALQSTSNSSGRAVIDLNTDALQSSLPLTGDRSDTTVHLPNHKSESSGTSPDLPIVFVVDDDVSARKSMDQVISREGWQPETFALAREFFDRPRPHVPNCLVVNISPRDLSGLEVQKRIVVERAETPIIFITDHGDVPTSVQAMKAGAVEFLIKPFTDKALFDAIREALKRSSIALGREAEMRMVRDSYSSLSHRERQVMALVLSGLLNKQIGSELGISEITVKAHRGRVMQKMGAKSVVDLVRMATRLRSERALVGSGHPRSPSPSPISGSPDRRMNKPASSSGPTLIAASGRS